MDKYSDSATARSLPSHIKSTINGRAVQGGNPNTLESLIRDEMSNLIEQMNNLLIKTARLRVTLFGEGEQSDAQAGNGGGGIISELEWKINRLAEMIEKGSGELNRILAVVESSDSHLPHNG